MDYTSMVMDMECGSIWNVETFNNIYPKSFHRLKLTFMML